MATLASEQHQRISTAETLARSSSYTSPNYHSYVTKAPGLNNAPAEATSVPHHVKNSSGNISKFKNPYPSWGGPPKAFKEIIW